MRYSAANKPQISVIVCHHTGELLYEFIESIFKSEHVSFEVIVMTSDEKLALTGIKNCMVFHDEGLPAVKRNAGARIAKGHYLAFFDDDVIVDKDCLWHLKESITNDVVMTYGKLWNREHTNRFDEAGSFVTTTGFLWSRAAQNEIDSGQYNKEEYVLSGKSANCMIRKDLFKRIEGFDESFGILGEETDLAWRLWLRGHKILYVPQATGLHAFNTKWKPATQYYTSKRVHYNGCRNYITMLLKNLGKEHLWIIIPHSLIWFFAGLAMLGTGKFEQGWNIWKGLFYVMCHLKEILEKRGRIQSQRKLEEKDLWPIISRKTPKGYYLQRFTRYLRIGLHG